MHGAMAIRERMNAIEPDDPSIAGMSVAAWLERQPDPADAKTAFRSMIEGLWCLALDKVPLWYLIDNDRRITNEVPELQYFAARDHAVAGRRIWRGDLGDRVRLGDAGDAHRAWAGKACASSRRAASSKRDECWSRVPPAMAAKLDFRAGACRQRSARRLASGKAAR